MYRDHTKKETDTGDFQADLRKKIFMSKKKQQDEKLF